MGGFMLGLIVGAACGGYLVFRVMSSYAAEDKPSAE